MKAILISQIMKPFWSEKVLNLKENLYEILPTLKLSVRKVQK